jgi:hypothetical protein
MVLVGTNVFKLTNNENTQSRTYYFLTNRLKLEKNIERYKRNAIFKKNSLRT